MASVEEIRQSIQRRLDELLDETERLRAAIKALSADDREPNPGRGPVTRPAVQRFPNPRPSAARTHNEQQRITGTRDKTLGATAHEGVRDGEDSAAATVRKRMLSQLRRELTAGLRTT